jgi:hypothetical protein
MPIITAAPSHFNFCSHHYSTASGIALCRLVCSTRCETDTIGSEDRSILKLSQSLVEASDPPSMHVSFRELLQVAPVVRIQLQMTGYLQRSR